MSHTLYCMSRRQRSRRLDKEENNQDSYEATIDLTDCSSSTNLDQYRL